MHFPVVLTGVQLLSGAIWYTRFDVTELKIQSKIMIKKRAVIVKIELQELEMRDFRGLLILNGRGCAFIYTFSLFTHGDLVNK